MLEVHYVGSFLAMAQVFHMSLRETVDRLSTFLDTIASAVTLPVSQSTAARACTSW
jgi:hypothetical protein